MAPEPTEVVRAVFRAFEERDRDAIERLLADAYTFSSPADVGLDRNGFFARCWPNADVIEAFDFVRLADLGGGEVLVTYEATRRDGSRFRNTEVLRVDGDRLTATEVYFGWNL
jgi:hypothetical protein